jgi:hypothetical protein
VGERDFCQECGTWLVEDNTRLKMMDHEGIVFRFGDMPFEPIVTSTLQPLPPVQIWLANTEQC